MQYCRGCVIYRRNVPPTCSLFSQVAYSHSSVKTKVNFSPSAEAEASVVKNAEYSAEDEASAEDRRFGS